LNYCELKGALVASHGRGNVLLFTGSYDRDYRDQPVANKPSRSSGDNGKPFGLWVTWASEPAACDPAFRYKKAQTVPAIVNRKQQKNQTKRHTPFAGNLGRLANEGFGSLAV
jgi:hypothetical protein